MSQLSDTHDKIKGFLEKLPHAHPKRPDAFVQKLKYFFWRLYTPYHTFFRDTLLKLGVIKHYVERQHFLLGTLAPGHSLEEVISHLVAQGYGLQTVAWEDEGELLSLRRAEDFVRQYHLRVFRDGEIRGHYEYTPECHPILHLLEVGFEDRRQEFLKLLGNHIVAATPHWQTQ